MSHIYIPKTQEEKQGIARWMSDRIKEPVPAIFEALAVMQDDKLVAGILYYNYFGESINLSLAADTPKAANKTIFKAMLGYPFKQLGCKRVNALIRKRNTRSRKLAEGLGFKLEGVLRKATPDGKDLCIYGLLDTEFRIGRFA